MVHVRVREIFQDGQDLGFALFAVQLLAEELNITGAKAR